MNTVEHAPEYLYIVSDVIPEILPLSVAYRPAGRAELAGRKIIRCPHCGEYLTDTERNARVQLYRKPKNKPFKPYPGQVFRKCDICKNEVGFVVK